jgi:hypothetical protein
LQPVLSIGSLMVKVHQGLRKGLSGGNDKNLAAYDVLEALNRSAKSLCEMAWQVR